MYQNLIDGADVAGFKPNRNPSDPADVVGEFAQADAAQVDAAISAARAAQPGWEDTPVSERAAILDRIGTALLDRAEEVAQLLAREEGKAIRDARGEARRAGTTFRYYAAQLMNPVGAVYQSAVPNMRVHTVRRAVGVVGVITRGTSHRDPGVKIARRSRTATRWCLGGPVPSCG